MIPRPISQQTHSTTGWRHWTVWVAACLGAMLGLGTFTFNYGGGTSYLSNDPAACANCHIMHGHFESWQHSSHQRVAVCNDCHVPHDFLGKWFTKADNGLLHSWAFTFGGYPEPLQIKARNRRVTQNACLHCHGEFVHAILPALPDREPLNCVHCHSAVGHAHR